MVWVMIQSPFFFSFCIHFEFRYLCFVKLLFSIENKRSNWLKTSNFYLRNKKEIMMNVWNWNLKGADVAKWIKAVDCEFTTRGFDPRRSPTLKEKRTTYFIPYEFSSQYSL